MDGSKVRIVCVSDTHNYRPGEGFTLPKGDILIHAGDLTNQGTPAEVEKALDWISKADFAVKLVVAGNHDLSLDADFASNSQQRKKAVPAAEDIEACKKLVESHTGIVYLQHSHAVITLPGTNEKIRVFGSPCTPSRPGKDTWAFQYDDDQADAVWGSVPDNIDILITHTPPAGHCDQSAHWNEGGCRALKSALCRIRPLLHVCGHCHEGRGAVVLSWGSNANEIPTVARTWEDPGIAGVKKQSRLDASNPAIVPDMETLVVNAAILKTSFKRGQRKEFHKPVVIDIQFPPRRKRRITNSANTPKE